MLSDLPKPDASKMSRYHDNYLDALIDEALDEMQKEKDKGANTEQ